MKHLPEKLNTLLLAVIAICLILITVQLFMWPKQAASVDEDASAQSAKASGTSSTASTTSAPSMVSIDTPYVTLQYPAEYADYLDNEVRQDDGVYANTFSCVKDGQATVLFTVYFGAPDIGENFGYLNCDGQQVAFTIAFPDAVSEETDLLIRGMLEAVNDVIACVQSHADFVGTDI